MSSCTGLFGRWFGHHFIPLYSKEPVNRDPFADIERASTSVARELINANIRWTYCGVYCTRCGIQQQESENP